MLLDVFRGHPGKRRRRDYIPNVVIRSLCAIKTVQCRDNHAEERKVAVVIFRRLVLRVDPGGEAFAEVKISNLLGTSETAAVS